MTNKSAGVGAGAMCLVAAAAVAAQGLFAGEKLVLVQRNPLSPTHVYTYHVEGQRPGGGLWTFDRASRELKRLVDASKGIILDAEPSFDGRSILFSFKPTMQDKLSIWRIGADGSGLVRITDGRSNCQNACHLPDGGIAYTCDLKPAFAYCWISTSPVLFRCDGDGRNPVRISANYLSDFTPSVMDDGRILFSRWEYVDRPAIPIQSLWAINPDGTMLSGVFGNRVLSPATFMFAHALPGRPAEFLCVMTAHNGPCSGAIGLVDVSKGGNAQEAIRNLTPEVRVPPVTDGFGGNCIHGPYTTPYPLGGDRYLVSRAGTVQERSFDGSVVTNLLAGDAKGLGWYSPRPLAPRPVPRLAHARRLVPDSGPWAEVFLQNVNTGLEGYVKPGEVVRIAVVQEMEKDVLAHWHKRAFGFQFPVVSAGATYAPKRVWGFAKVEPDGSAHFKAPANVPIYFLPLDRHGRAVQRMRTFTHFMPGERQSCVGCHADRNYVSATPAEAIALAAQRPAEDLTPPTWGRDFGFSFARIVQPILDRRCATCHSGEKGAPEPELTGDRTDYFNVAYENLVRRGTAATGSGDLRRRGMRHFGRNPWVSWIPTFNGVEDNILEITPKYWGSPASKLVDIILAGHPDRETGRNRVKLTDDEILRICMWIDLDVPYYGTSQSHTPELRGCRHIFPEGIMPVHDEIARRKNVKFPYAFFIRLDHPEKNSCFVNGIRIGAFTGPEDPDYQRLLKEFAPAQEMLKLRNDVDFRDVICPPMEDPKRKVK